MADYAIPVTIVPVDGSVVKDGVIAYEAIDAGSLVYRRSDGKWAKSRSNAAATAPCHGIAVSSAEGANQRFSVLAEGDATVSGGTKGAVVFVSPTTAGKGCPHADIVTAGAGTTVNYVGIFTSATNLRIKPHNTAVVL